MPRRIDVELTSSRDDGTWTWRAAGAKQPKGVIAAALLQADAKVGDVLQAEAEFDIEGITIISVQAPKKKAGPANLIPVEGATDDFEPVITNWRERPGGRDRDPYGERAPRGDRPGGGGGGGGAGGRGGDRGGLGPRPTADWRAKVAPPAPPPGSERGDRDRGGGRGGRGRREGAGPGARERDRDRGRPADRDRSGAGAASGGPPSDRRSGPGLRRDRPEAPRRDRPAREPVDARPRPKRLSPGNTHRTAVMESLSPEQRPVAEQVLRGGIPAVRRAIEEQNATAKESGQPEIKPGPLVALAEELLPRLKTAEWHDRAEAALTDVDEIGLRDLRSVVSGADAAARDEQTRTLAANLREALERRLKKQQDDWVAEIVSALDESRLVRALRSSARPPDPSMRVPADLALRLSGAASEAMAGDTPAERWAALLEAVAASPVRTTVKPASLPTDAPEALLAAARQQAGRIPALTTLLGISMPPPPGPIRRIPPKPSRPPASAPRTAAAAAAPVAATPEEPAPPTPVSEEPPVEPATPPEATAPIAPVEPAVPPVATSVEEPADS
jgi:hypothetical protein